MYLSVWRWRPLESLIWLLLRKAGTGGGGAEKGRPIARRGGPGMTSPPIRRLRNDAVRERRWESGKEPRAPVPENEEGRWRGEQHSLSLPSVASSGPGPLLGPSLPSLKLSLPGPPRPRTNSAGPPGLPGRSPEAGHRGERLVISSICLSLLAPYTKPRQQSSPPKPAEGGASCLRPNISVCA